MNICRTSSRHAKKKALAEAFAQAFAVLCLLIPPFELVKAADPPKPLQIYFVDVEGGQSTLFVTPAGQSLLIDTGWPGNNGRDADRIVAAAKSAGVAKIDVVLLTHYHANNSGGIPQLADLIPIGAFVDHGENREQDSPSTREIFYNYLKTLGAKGIKRIIAKPGDVLPISGLTVTVVSADGAVI